MLTETRTLIQTQRARLIPQVVNIEMYDLSKYSVKQSNSTYEVGQAITVDWEAPSYHGKRDWIGIYKVGSNKNKQVTNISSRGLWKWAANLLNDVSSGSKTSSRSSKSSFKSKETEEETTKQVDDINNDDTTQRQEQEQLFDFTKFSSEVGINGGTNKNNKDVDIEHGTVTLGGNQLPWEAGTYELRYHHDGKHNVMAISAPFEIVAPSRKDASDTNVVQHQLLRLVQNAVDNNPEIMPVSPTDQFIGLGEMEARHIVDVIKLSYGVEFAWEVVLADGSVARLTKRVSDYIFIFFKNNF